MPLVPNPTNLPILDKAEPSEYAEGQPVDLVVKSRTDLGYKAIVNGKHWGILYKNEIFQTLELGQITKGYIKKIREDGKIDLSLYKTGHKSAEDLGPKILTSLKNSDGFLPINEKTTPEYIYSQFGVSKKKFKIVLSGLYKSRLITINDDGIRLVKKNP